MALSEQWLAVRRSVPYFSVAAAVLISMRIKRPLVDAILPQMLDMKQIKAVAAKKHNLPALKREINRVSYLVSTIFVIVGVISYVLTRVVIISPTASSGFNEEYARLRILSLPFTSLPLLIGAAACIMYLIARIEKLTGLKSEDLMKKK